MIAQAVTSKQPSALSNGRWKGSREYIIPAQPGSARLWRRTLVEEHSGAMQLWTRVHDVGATSAESCQPLLVLHRKSYPDLPTAWSAMANAATRVPELRA